MVPRPVRPAPDHIASSLPADRPAVLVDELVVEQAREDQVVEIGGSASGPPPDVMGLRPSSRGAARKGASPVPVAQLAHHPLGGFPRRPAQPDHVAGGALDDGLDAGIAEEPSVPGSRGRPPPRNRPSACRRRRRGHGRDGRPICGGIVGEPGGCEGHQRVGPAPVGEERVLLTRHRGQRVGQPPDGPRDDRPLGRGEIRRDPNRRPSSYHHQARERASSPSRTSWSASRRARSPR